MPNVKSKASEREKVFHFIESVDQEMQRIDDLNALKNSDTYKINLSKKECERGKEECLRHIIHKFYRNATPLSDEYKDAKCNDMLDDLDRHCPHGLLFYFREAIKRGDCSKRCQRMVEAVEKTVNDAYKDKLVHPENYNEDDLIFRMDPEMMQRVDYLSDELDLDDVSDMVRRSVQTTTMSEVKRAKEEKEKNKELEKELANDLNVTSESTMQYALSRHGMNQPRIFQPTLLQGILIGAADQRANTVTESYNYHALEEYGFEGEQNTPIYEAFADTVREYTWLVMEDCVFHTHPKSLIEKRKLADEYARGKRQVG